jgi:hypothetical protein
MKISASVREIYDDMSKELNLLRSYADGILQPLAQTHRWHYESRVKGLESFALKLETGRIPAPLLPEDGFACTFVVQNSTEIDNCIAALSSDVVLFRTRERRPPARYLSTRPPDTFAFDDVRLYGRFEDLPGTAPKNYLRRPAEIQVKTFLQHAWAIATHDLIYKSDGHVSWSRARIAYQIRAGLEHAEATIRAIDSVADLLGAPNEHMFELSNRYIEVICRFFEDERLPRERKRLGENVQKLAEAFELDTTKLISILEGARKKGRGPALLNFGPFFGVLDAIASELPAEIYKVIKTQKYPNKRSRFIVLLTPEFLAHEPMFEAFPKTLSVRI